MPDDHDLERFVQALAGANDPRAVVSHLLSGVACALLRAPSSDRRHLSTEISLAAAQLRQGGSRRTMREEVRRLRERLVRHALEEADNNVALAARRLGVSRNLIYEITARAQHR